MVLHALIDFHPPNIMKTNKIYHSMFEGTWIWWWQPFAIEVYQEPLVNPMPREITKSLGQPLKPKTEHILSFTFWPSFPSSLPSELVQNVILDDLGIRV
jgi:hypothetical protein